MALNYFGTDGIRGRVDGPLMNARFMLKLGRALSAFLHKHNRSNKPLTVVVGRDTRASGMALQDALLRGFGGSGVHLFTLGVVPTPAVSMAVRDLHADLGIAITASHNPIRDNGIKLFDNRGLKFAVKAEAEIESFINDEEAEATATSKPEAEVETHEHDGCAFYINYLRSLQHQGSLKGWKVVLDTANGASTATSPPVFRHFGAEVIQIGADPDGDNINRNVGSEHPEVMAAAVRRHQARIGIAHDGDGDRVVICDELGQVLHGDELLGLLGLHALETGNLQAKTLVTTVQSNFGLDRALEAAGGKVERVDIGDRNVLRHMVQNKFNVGGESSGHLIFLDHAVAGDGLLGAIKTVELMLATGKTLSALRQRVTLFPQQTLAMDVAVKRPLEDCPRLRQTRDEIEAEVRGRGRLLVRYSGTENKLRLLVEAECKDSLNGWMRRLAAAAQQDLSTPLPG